ncbi:MAG: MBL fold metallo-hydrolase [Sarcina sp.]
MGVVEVYSENRNDFPKNEKDRFINLLLKADIEWQLKDYNQCFKNIKIALENFVLEKTSINLAIKLAIITDNFQLLIDKLLEMNLSINKIKEFIDGEIINKIFFHYYKWLYFKEKFDELKLFKEVKSKLEKSIFFYITYMISKNKEFLHIAYSEYKENLSVAKLLYLKKIDLDIEVLRILYKKDIKFFLEDNVVKEDKEIYYDFAFLPLGGGNEIGANSYIITIDNSKIIVDAGMKIGINGNEYPDYEKVTDFIKLVDVVIITHGHLDHWGAIHKLYEINNNLEIIMTLETRELIKIASKNSDMNIKEKFQLEELLEKSKVVTFNEVFLVGQDKTPCRLYRAGHILGAASLFIKGKKGNVLFSGDYSLEEQLTVQGMELPKEEIDIFITESTYRNRAINEIGSKTLERELFKEYILASINKGKNIFIPAFAIGRSQEIIEILKNIAEKENFRIYVDGMSIEVSEFYNKYSTLDLKGKRIHYLKNNYYESKKDFIEEEFMNNRACLVASSGMLKEGSTSSVYGKLLLSNENIITIITGYQGKDTVGARLLEQLKLQCERYLLIESEKIKINSIVKKYNFTAHCEIDEILATIKKIKAKRVVLIHGECSLDNDYLLEILKINKFIKVYQGKNNELLEF